MHMAINTLAVKKHICYSSDIQELGFVFAFLFSIFVRESCTDNYHCSSSAFPVFHLLNVVHVCCVACFVINLCVIYTHASVYVPRGDVPSCSSPFSVQAPSFIFVSLLLTLSTHRTAVSDSDVLPGQLTST